MADITTLGESSQALLCSLADWLGDTKTNELFDISKYDTYDSFKKAVKSENIKTSYQRIPNKKCWSIYDIGTRKFSKNNGVSC